MQTKFYKKWVQVSHDLDECYQLIKDDKIRHYNRQLKKKDIEEIRHYLNHNIAIMQAIQAIIAKK